jgi:hypothetical protein
VPDAGAPEVDASAWIVGIEPNCILTLRDELPDLVRDGRTKALAAASVTLEEFLASLPDYKPGRLERRAIVHGHCHQKALVGMEPTRQVLSKVEGLEFSILDSGCCGMAGSFGYEQGHYDVSQACGERVLFPAATERKSPIGNGKIVETIHHEGRVITAQQITRTSHSRLLYAKDSGEYLVGYPVSVGPWKIDIEGFHTLTSGEVAAYQAGTLDLAEFAHRLGQADQASGRYEQKPAHEE